ncbi:hypothetical protein ACJRO7_013582 [Eucalyptus globulus]|uniref:TIR domain-containing protein n=1 Tax=Eucalyptus globulus TaxID=34317 RepID=A0ABD3KX90_EUCGL
MGNRCSKRPRDNDASSPTISKKQRHEQSAQWESESPHLLPSSDSLKKIDVPSASGANSDPYASSTFENGNNYYVFLSFRGTDTRKGFVDHLYQRLRAVGLRCHTNPVCRDDEDLPFGENIGENLISAIERSKVSIPIISENYADSEWCLRELIHIMNCKESRGQMVLPVLYKVAPKDVRHLEGNFGKAFESCKDKFEEEVKQQGPLALRKAVDLRVYESENFADGHEAELVNKLVEIILREQQHDFQPCLPMNLVGIDDRVAEVMKLMDIDCPDTRIIGIYGIGGIGKTTLATIIYNKLFDKFEGRSFLKDIRETIKNGGVTTMQSQLISDVLKLHNFQVPDSDRGINTIRSCCTQKKILILLDDVDCQDQLNNLIGGCSFKSGSRIIVTSRDKALLKSEYEYEFKEMSCEDSLLLFSRYAFEREQPPTELAPLSTDIVATTGGLPLALVVIGSLLKGKEDQGEWREMLKKLIKAPNMTVQQKLKISYDALEPKEQQIFLDIACFFIGTDKRSAIYLWDDLELYPLSALAKMAQRMLIKCDNNNKLRMHDQLRDLGRVITCPADKKSWEWSRLWDEEAMKVLRRKNDNENIEALHLDERGSREFMERGSFTKMPNLKFLHLNAVGFAGDFKESLTELRWLKWERCCDSLEATSVHLEKLVVLELSSHEDIRNPISENWRGWSSIKMERLKVLNLSCSLKLKSNPNLSTFESLELLILEGCANLKEIDPSIQYAKRLLILNLSYCRSLEMLPEQLGELENLEELVVDETRIKEIPSCIGSLKKLKRLSAQWDWRSKHLSLKKIPSSIGKLGELVELNLSNTRIKELPESIGKLNKLKILNICDCEIERIPSSIGKLQSLQKLDASSCTKLKGQILVDKGGLSSLKTVYLSRTNISGLPENLDQLSSLEHLHLYHCYELESLPKPPFSLSSLQLTCQSNELPSLSHLKHLQQLSLHDCKSLQSIPSLSHLKCLRKLDLYHCESLQSIPELSHLEHLQELELFICESLQSIRLLSHLKHLQQLLLWDCMSLQEILELPSCIQVLVVWNCPKVERFPNLSDLEFLSNLVLVNCNGLKKLDGLGSLKSLRQLHLWLSSAEKVDHLHAIEGLEKLGSLEVVDIYGRKHIQVLDLSKSEHLKWLKVDHCESLVEIRCPSKFLKHFDRSGCESLKKLPDLFIEESNSEKLTKVCCLSSDLTFDSTGYNLMRATPKRLTW